MMNGVAIDRHALVQRGKKIEYFTLIWCGLEALVGIVAGFIAGSVSLTGFGLDSLIEVTSAAALLWRFHREFEIVKPREGGTENASYRRVLLPCPCHLHHMRFSIFIDPP
jgi:hypothetical protein